MVGKICTVCRRCSFIDRQLSFFTYPGDQQRRHEWLRAVHRMDLMHKVDNCKTRGNHRICEVHFEQKYVRRSKSVEGRKFLTKDAFPTLCLNASSSIMPMTKNIIKISYPLMYANDIAWSQYYTDKTNICVSQKPIMIKQEKNPIQPERRSVRQQQKAFKNNMSFNLKNEPYFKGESPPSSPHDYEDISQFCESVIKVSKGTQTLDTRNNRRNIDNFPQDNIKMMKTAESLQSDKQTFMQMCSTFLPPSLSKIIKWGLSSNSGHNINLTLFAINLYYTSNMYNLLKNLLSLPNKDTLKYFLLPKSTRLSETFINAFRCKVNNMSTKEKVCSFAVGSVLLKPNLYYDIKHDRMIGFHDVNGVQNICIAKYAILVMVQGILENWRQPIAYALISEYDNFAEISSWIDEVLTTLIDIGLDVRAFVSDPRSEFLYASDSRFVTSEKTCFTINGTDIFYTYDTTQLLKIVKNNFKSCDFEYGSNSNISNNNDFYQKLIDLCNILNARTQHANTPYKRAFANKKYQKQFLYEMLQLFQNLKVIRKADGADVTENMKFIEGFQITINSVMQLFEELNVLGVKSLLMTRLNHNDLNNFFTKVKRNNSKEECTPRQFNKIFVRSFVYNILKKPLGDSNDNSLEPDDFSQQLLDEEFPETKSNTNKPLSVYTTDYRWGLPEKNAFVYVCGYCYLKCIQRHCCDTFKSYLNDYQGRQQKPDVYVCSVSLDLNVNNCEMLPPDEFTEFLMLLESKFKECLTSDIPICNIGHDIMQKIKKYEFGMPCPCFPIDYLKALFIRVRLFYTIRKNNRLLERKKGVKMFRVFSL